MYLDRRALYEQIEAERESRVLVYVTGDRPKMETQIHSEVLDFVAEHLDTFGLPDRISLVLYTRGGDTLAAWTIANMLRQFCGEFEVIVPMKAHSAGTLISLGATNIVMSKQATLGPIDPSVNSPLNPQVPAAPPEARVPVSVEEVAAYFDLATKHLDLQDERSKAEVFLKLADEVHPLALGRVYRARTQIQRLAERLLETHMDDKTRIAKIISVLCSESGSHDYTINRREARALGLEVETPTQQFYELMNAAHMDIRGELQLTEAFDLEQLLANVPLPASQSPGAPPQPQAPPVKYSAVRCLIESTTGGTHHYVTEGIVNRALVQTPAGPMPGVAQQRTFEGWRHEPAT